MHNTHDMLSSLCEVLHTNRTEGRRTGTNDPFYDSHQAQRFHSELMNTVELVQHNAMNESKVHR